MPNRSKSPDTQQSSSSLNAAQIAFKTQEKDKRDQFFETVEKIWGEDADVTSRTIDNYIVSLRKYFEQDPKEPKYFHTIRSVGYRFTP